MDLISEAGVTAPPIIALGSSFTIEAWICPETLSSEHATILSKWRGDCEHILPHATEAVARE